MINNEKNGITEGRIVLFAIADGVKRPALVVNAWKDSAYQQGEVNLSISLDFTNDRNYSVSPEECARGTAWRTSVPYSSQGVVGTWSWPDGHLCDETSEEI